MLLEGSYSYVSVRMLIADFVVLRGETLDLVLLPAQASVLLQERLAKYLWIRNVHVCCGLKVTRASWIRSKRSA